MTALCTCLSKSTTIVAQIGAHCKEESLLTLCRKGECGNTHRWTCTQEAHQWQGRRMPMTVSAFQESQPRSLLRPHQERGMHHIAVVQKVVVPPA